MFRPKTCSPRYVQFDDWNFHSVQEKKREAGFDKRCEMDGGVSGRWEEMSGSELLTEPSQEFVRRTRNGSELGLA
jgi:hypothetical protein